MATLHRSDALKRAALELGFTSVGICDAVPSPHIDAYRAWIAKGYHGTMSYLDRHQEAKGDPRTLLPSAKSIVAVTLNYNQLNSWKPGAPKIARYALGRDYHKVMAAKLKRLTKEIEKRHPGAESRAVVDSAPILERDYAWLAGLGWFGKNTCLIDSRRGSWFFIGLTLTSVHFLPDLPAVGGCGTCTRCIEACPTGALVFKDDRWQLDARRCISYLTIEHEGRISEELSEKLSGWTFGCDICQEVCPFNQPRASQPLRATQTEEPDFLNPRRWPDLKQLRQISFEDWDELTRGSPVRRAGHAGLKRNARLSLEFGVSSLKSSASSLAMLAHDTLADLNPT